MVLDIIQHPHLTQSVATPPLDSSIWLILYYLDEIWEWRCYIQQSDKLYYLLLDLEEVPKESQRYDNEI